MPILNDSRFFQECKEGLLPPVAVFYGSERYLLDKAVELLAQKAVDGASRDYFFRRFDGANVDLDQFCAEVEELPLMANHKCVLLSNFSPDKAPKETTERILSLIADPNPSTVLIITVPGEISAKKSAKLRKLRDAGAKTGVSVEFLPRSGRDLIALVAKEIRENGGKISDATVRFLIEYCGEDIKTLLSEGEKLVDFCAGREITREDVETVTHKSLEAKVFDLSRHLLRQNGAAAFSLLRDLLLLKEEPIAILGVLNMAFIDLYRAAAAKKENRPVEELIASFPYKGKEFRARNAYRDCGKRPLSIYREIIFLLAETDRKLKSAPGDRALFLEEALAENFNAAERIWI